MNTNIPYSLQVMQESWMNFSYWYIDTKSQATWRSQYSQVDSHSASIPILRLDHLPRQSDSQRHFLQTENDLDAIDR